MQNQNFWDTVRRPAKNFTARHECKTSDFLTIHVGLRHLLRMLPWPSNPVEFATYAKALFIELTTWLRSLWDQCFLQRGLPGGLWVGRPLSSRASCMHRERWSQGQTHVQLLGLCGFNFTVFEKVLLAVILLRLAPAWDGKQGTPLIHWINFNSGPNSFCAAAWVFVEKCLHGCFKHVRVSNAWGKARLWFTEWISIKSNNMSNKFVCRGLVLLPRGRWALLQSQVIQGLHFNSITMSVRLFGLLEGLLRAH